MTDVSHDTLYLHDTAHNTQVTANRSSIDLSLELERQLDSEYLSSDSPTVPSRANSNDGANRTSLDPHVLAHIVTQLRDSLTNLSQERDELIHQLAESHSREAEFKDSLALWSERCAGLEKDIATLRKKSQDDDEAISMLRSKVEESRRGLMRLQSERKAETKRMTLDLSNARTPSFGGPRSSQRTSFTPLTGSGHPGPSSFRRASSTPAAENDPEFVEFVAGLPSSVGGQTPVFESVDNHAAASNRRRSMLVQLSSGQYEGRSSYSMAELDALKQELAATRAELEETRHELSESNEAREASETCVNALRDFIAQSGTSVSKVQLPPLPSDLRIRDVEPEPKPKSTGWGGLKLWRVDTNTSAASPPSFTSAAPRKSIDAHSTTNIDHESPSPSTAVPLRSKFGALFSRGSSISSIPYVSSQAHQEEPIVNGSDVSSSTEEQSEPTSPAADKVLPVLVRESVVVGAEGGTETVGGAQNAYTSHESVGGDDMKIVAL